jgi:hypothetical protein
VNNPVSEPSPTMVEEVFGAADWRVMVPPVWVQI